MAAPIFEANSEVKSATPPFTCHKVQEGRKCLFNDALNTFYLRLYGVGHMVNDNSDSEI